MRRDRDLHLLTGAVGLSALGDLLGFVPLALRVQGQTGSGLAVAALFIALWSPAFVLARPAGLLADRVESRRLLITVALAQAAVCGALAFVEGAAATVALTVLVGAGFAIAQPAEFALVPAAAGEDRLAAANGRIEAARGVGFTLGPMAGGLLAAAGGTRFALLADAASFLALAGGVALMRARRQPEPASTGRAGNRASAGGMAILLADAQLRAVLPVALVSLLFMTASAAAEPFFARDVLHAGDGGYGALLTMWTLGMVLGSAVIATRLPAARFALLAVVAIAVQSAGLGAPATWPVLVFGLGAFFVGGLAHGAKNVVLRTLIHARVPPAARGRAFAAYNGARNAAELVALLAGGVLVTAAGARLALLLAGALPLAAALAGLARVTQRPVGDLAASPARP
jgi:MFS family permease